MKERRISMKQVIPFHKEIVFRTMIGEITSISLEHTLKFETESTIRGDLIVSGTYKMTEASQIEEDFEYRLPVDIEVADHYDVKNSKIEIDDFYYEIINDDVLKVNIDVLLDGVEEERKEILPAKEEISLEEEVIKSHLEKEDLREEVKEQEMLDNEVPILQDEAPTVTVDDIKNESKQEKVVEVTPKKDSSDINSIFSAFKDTDETFATYSVYIVRENDTLDQILDRYHCSKEQLAKYNNLDDLALGTKLIVPSTVSSDA